VTLAIGVDVGGTKVAAGVVDEDGRIIAKLKRSTPAASPARTEQAIADAVTELLAHHQVKGNRVEAIGLGHDLGHPPFGHAGEEALDELLRERGGRGFRHNEHSLRVVERLEREGRGLNLTWEVRDGILKHTGPEEPETLEGKIVRIVDRVAYINHDIDDAIRAGMLAAHELPQQEIAVLGKTGSRRIDTLVHDLVETSADAGDIVQSDEIGGAMLSLRGFMFERVYLGPQSSAEHASIRATIRRIFEHLVDVRGDDVESATDYLAGMTDRFALAYEEELP